MATYKVPKYDAVMLKASTKIERAAAMPATGTYTKGTIVFNTVATVQGSTPNKYILLGWYRLTDGTGHVLNTDWVEMRTLTGT